MSNVECDYSFEMLYKAAFGKSLSKKEIAKLQTSSQNEINSLVLIWATKAGWTTDRRLGDDGKDYIAFYK